MVNENSPHRLGGRREEVSAILPARIIFANQAKIRLVHQGGRLQRMSGRFSGHAMPGQLAQLIINQRQQLAGGLGLATVDGLEDLRHVEIEMRANYTLRTAGPKINQHMPSFYFPEINDFTLSSGGLARPII